MLELITANGTKCYEIFVGAKIVYVFMSFTYETTLITSEFILNEDWVIECAFYFLFFLIKSVTSCDILLF